MDKQHPPTQPSYPYPGYSTPDNLARQPYPAQPPNDAEPQAEEPTVVAMPSKPRSPEGIAEDPLSPRPPAKRKATKARSAASKAKKPLRPTPSTHQQPFLDELQYLEAWADRINQTLAKRSQTAQRLPSQQAPAGGSPSQPQLTNPPFPEPIDDPDQLIRQAQHIQQRVAAIQAMLAQSQPIAPPSPPPIPEPSPATLSPPPTNRHPAAPPSPPPLTNPTFPPEAPVAPEWPEPGSWQPMEDSRPGKTRARTAQALVVRQLQAYLLRLRQVRFRAVPARFSDRLSDAAIWIAISVAVRIASRYVLAAFPAAAPVLTLLMLAPAALAVFLALFAPHLGWQPFYRLLLIMLGLLLGGKF